MLDSVHAVTNMTKSWFLLFEQGIVYKLCVAHPKSAYKVSPFQVSNFLHFFLVLLKFGRILCTLFPKSVFIWPDRFDMNILMGNNPGAT